MAKPKVEEVKPEVKKAGRPPKVAPVVPVIESVVEEPKVEVAAAVPVVEEPEAVEPMVEKIFVSIDQDLHTDPVVVVPSEQKIEGTYIPGHPIPVQPTPVHLIGHLLP